MATDQELIKFKMRDGETLIPRRLHLAPSALQYSLLGIDALSSLRIQNGLTKETCNIVVLTPDNDYHTQKLA